MKTESGVAEPGGSGGVGRCLGLHSIGAGGGGKQSSALSGVMAPYASILGVH